MSDRRTLSSSLSAEVTNYLRKRGHSQAKIAALLGVSEGFISLVKSKERSLTVDHLERLADKLSIPLGVLLLVATPQPKNASGDLKKFFDLSAKIVEKADQVSRSILHGAAGSR